MSSTVVITTTSFGRYDTRALKVLQDEGFKVVLNPHGRTLEAGEVVELCRDALGIIAGTETLSAEVLEQIPGVKVISRCGAGLENLDLGKAHELGIRVFNTPDAPTLAVAELTVALMLNLLRHVSMSNEAVKQGRWQKPMGHLLYQKRVGIVGLGRIGSKVATLLQGFGCEIAYHDPLVACAPPATRSLPLRDLLAWADIVSVHASSKSMLLGEREIVGMKKGAWLVNVARGALVDEHALYRSLSSGHLSGAALDVFREEPYTGPLRELPNAILTAHIGSYAEESRTEMELSAAVNLLQGIRDYVNSERCQ